MATTHRQKSGVWEYFNEPIDCEEGKGKEKALKKGVPCKLCDIKLSDRGGTSNLRSHLQAKHPLECQQLMNSRAERYYRFSDISRYFKSIDIAIFPYQLS